MTASIANREIIDGIEVVVQEPNYEKEELAYLEMTSDPASATDARERASRDSTRKL